MPMIFLVWFIFGAAGSVMIGLGASTDNQGIDEVDVLILGAIAGGGLVTFLFGIPMLYIWLERKFG